MDLYDAGDFFWKPENLQTSVNPIESNIFLQNYYFVVEYFEWELMQFSMKSMSDFAGSSR